MEGVAIMEILLIAWLWAMLELGGWFFFSGVFLHKREKNRYLIFLFLAVSIFMYLYSNSGINKLLKQIMTISVYLCFSLILYKGKWSARIFAVIGYYVFCSVLDALTLRGGSLLLGLGFEELIMQKLTYVAIVTLDKLILLLFACCFAAYLCSVLRSRFLRAFQRGNLYNGEGRPCRYVRSDRSSAYKR